MAGKTIKFRLIKVFIYYLTLHVAPVLDINHFIIFVNQLEKGSLPTVQRPPGIEAFLPISSLISLKYWILTGIINPIHPSGLVIFVLILGSAILFKKGFCS